MRRIVAVAILGILGSTGSIEAQESPLVGAWVTIEWVDQDASPQPGLLVFTGTHYSMMFVRPGMVRERYTGETETDADMVAAYRTLVANSGRYTVRGDEFTTEGYVTLNTNYMADWGENHITYTFRVEGDELHVTWPEDFLGGFTGTFRRVE